MQQITEASAGTLPQLTGGGVSEELTPDWFNHNAPVQPPPGSVQHVVTKRDNWDDSQLRREFADPPLRWQSRPLWFWNGKLDAEKTKGLVAACRAAGYYGMGILPCKGMGVDFMSPEFLKHYKVAVDEASRLGMKMCFYDEFWFPSGSAGGLLAKHYPEALLRNQRYALHRHPHPPSGHPLPSDGRGTG